MSSAELSLETPETSLSRDEFVSARPEEKDLKKKAVRGGAITGLSQVLRLAANMGSTAILARILTPADYGLVAMITVLNGFFSLFSNAGLAAATIQREKLTHAQVSSLYWINVALGTALALMVCAISPGIAWFYGEKALIPIACATSLTFVFAGLTVQHKALLGRKMQFTALSVADIVSCLIGVTTAVVFAALGFGYWSLVMLPLSTSASHLILIRLMMPWRPGRLRKGTGVRPLIRFGSDILIFDVVNYFARNLDSILIGRVWGRSTLGLYDRAYSLLMLPLNQVNRPLASVAAPALSRSKDLARQNLFLNAIRIVSIASLPIVALIAVFANEMVLLVLGPKWSQCAVLFQLLAVGAAMRALTNPVGWLLVSAGETAKYRRMGIANSLFIVVAFICGLPFGAEGVATAYSVVMVLIFIPLWQYVLVGSGIKLGTLLGTFIPAVTSCAVAASCAFFFRSTAVFQNSNLIFSLMMGGILFGAVYLSLLFFVFKQWSLCSGILKQFKK